jgi:hypothetical protein
VMERVAPGSGLLAQAVRLATLIGAGLVALAAAAFVLRVREVGTFTEAIRRQWQGRGAR